MMKPIFALLTALLLARLVASLRDGGIPELYDLDDDPGEQRNMAKERPAIVKKLIAAWQGWNAQMALPKVK